MKTKCSIRKFYWKNGKYVRKNDAIIQIDFNPKLRSKITISFVQNGCSGYEYEEFKAQSSLWIEYDG